jgi:antitoxin ParD1/3/4
VLLSSAGLPIFAKLAMFRAMSTMNISLPDALKAFVDQQVRTRGYGTGSEYMRELIRKDQDIQHLRELLLEGAGSPATAPADATYFASLRNRVTQRKAP